MGLGLSPPAPVVAQERAWARIGGHAAAVGTMAKPVPGGGRLDEVRVVHPVLVAEAGALGRLRLLATLNFEGISIEAGELTPGAWGEGYVDRRHPHTYVHELLVTADDLLGRRDGEAALSLSAGKGFAPFGTDDPMIRPPLRYPVNHHLAQILERAVAVAAIRRGPFTAELGVFNGDEPERPGQWPRIGRFGDSWSVRLTAEPVRGVEVQGSHARVHSPEHRAGAGTDQRKWSFSASSRSPIAGHDAEALVEWARTSEAGGFFVFHSLLGEGAWNPGPHRLHYRFERSERPEEERLSAFRSQRPHLENSILGVTRWTIHTVGYEFNAGRRGGVHLRPVAEVSVGTMTKVGGGLFQVEQVYGRDDFWAMSVGIRVGFGPAMPRMGRYGSARALAPARSHEH